MARVMGVWGVLSTGGLGARTQDMLKSLAEWFYATEYISLVSAAFRDLGDELLYDFQISIHLVITPLRLPDYRN